jgi:hypothetical protein
MTKEKNVTSENRNYEKVNFDDYDKFIAMVDRMLFKLTGKISSRTPEEETEMRAKFEKTKAENALQKKPD